MYARVWKQGILHDRYPVSDVRSVPVLSVPNRVQVLGPIFVKFILINPFPDTDLALWGNLCSVPSVLFSEVSSDYSKWCWVMLNMCGNTNSHIFRGSCKVRNELSFPRIIYPGAIRGLIRGRGQIIRETFFVSKCSNIMLNVCHNVRSHIFHDICEVLRRSNFCRLSSDNLSGDLSEAGDKLSEKLFSCPRKLSPHGVSSTLRGLGSCR